MATISATSTRITINGAYKAFVSSSGSTSTVIQFASGDAPASGDAGRFLMWKNGSATADWEIRFIESATASTVTVGDGGFSSAPASGEDFVISTNLADIQSDVPAACTVAGKSYSFNGRDWGLTNGAFLADVDISIDTEQSVNTSGYDGWNAANGCAVQFGRLTGGEANDSTITRQGCYISLNSTKPSSNSDVFGSGGSQVSNGPIFNFYGCYIKNYTPTASDWAFMRGTGPVRMIGSIWDGPIGGAFYHSASELVDTKFRGNTNLTPAWSIRATFVRPVSNVQFANSLAAFKTFQNFTGIFRNTVFDLNSLNSVVFVSGTVGGVTCIDSTTFTDSDVADNGNGFVHQAKSINYTITDANGTGLNGAKVAVYDTDGTLQGSLQTSSSGAVGEIVATFYKWQNSSPSANKAPFDIRIRLDGYVYLGFQSAVSEPIKQEVRLALNPQRVDVGANAAAITGIALNFTTETVTITQDADTQKLYDYYQYQLAQDAQFPYGEDLVRTGNSFDLDDWDMVVDGCTYTGDATTTGIITLANSAIFDGVRTDSNGTVYPPIDVTFTDIKIGSQLVVYLTGTTTEKFRTDNSSTTEQWTEAYTSDITYDVTIMKAGFFPIRLTGLVASTSARSRSINQLIDRAYQTSSGLTYSTNANLNINTKEFSVSVATTVQNYYSFWIEQWISNSVLRNVEFPISTFGGNSFSFDGGYEFTSSSLQYLSRDGFRYFSNNSVTARYAAILSQGVVAGAQPEYQQLQNGSITDAQNTGNVDQVIQIYGDATHGNFDYTNYLKFKVQANGYRQAEADIVSVFGTLEEQFYVTSLNTLQISNFTTGDPQVTGLSITDNTSNPVSWDAGDGTSRNYSLTITDTNNNSGENILRWLNYNLSLDVVFQGKEPFYYPEMVIDNGSSYETIRGVLYGTVSNTLAGVRVIDGNGDAHRDFVRFQSDNGSYGIPVEIKTGSVTQIVSGSRLRIYNITTSQQVFNDIVLGTSYTEEYEEGNNYSQGDQLEIRVSKIDKLEFKRVVIVGGDGWSQLVSQEDNNVYIEYGKDGSTVSGISWNSANAQFDFSDSDNEIEGADIAAWYFYFITTSTGIAEAFEAINWTQINRITNRSSVTPIKFNNTKTDPLIIKNCWINRDDGVSIIASSSNSIQIDPPAVFTSNIDDVEQILENTEKIQKKTKLIPASL